MNLEEKRGVRRVKGSPQSSGLFERLLHTSVPVLWAALLVLIPITSFPPVANVAGGIVGPLAGVPALLLLALLVVPRLLKGNPLPPLSGPLFAFVGIAVLASVAAVILELYPYLGQTVMGRSLRALATLGIGLGFYLVAATYPTTEGRLRASLRWLAVGGIAMLTWSTVQAFFTIKQEQIPWRLNEFHRLFSVRDLSSDRVTGLAYEPSWLADQLVVLYLPIWLAAILSGVSAFKKLAGRIPVEALLLGWGLIILVLTKSRIGLLSALAVAAGFGGLAIWRLAGRAARAEETTGSGSVRSRSRTRLGLRLVLLLTLLAVLIGGVYLLSQYDPRLERIFTARPPQLAGGATALYGYANQLAYAERVMYWASGLKTFGRYPLLGVGLGNSGFLFRETVPVFGYALPEIINILNGADQFPNPKSLWIRLLAETGLAGFLTFVLWIGAMALAGSRLTRGRSAVLRTVGLAGAIALAAQVFEGFSLDSFALPQLWIMLGLVTAAYSCGFGGQDHLDDGKA